MISYIVTFIDMVSMPIFGGYCLLIGGCVCGSFEDVKGFEITWVQALKDVRCFVFDISMQTLTFSQAEDIHFSAISWPIVPDKSVPPVFYFEGYSIPKPPDRWDKYWSAWLDASNYSYGINDGSANWVTPIFYSIDEASSENLKVKVNFVLPPAQYSFTIFSLRLLNQNSGSSSPAVNVTTDTLPHTFNNVHHGCYKLWVQPLDLYFNQGQRCLCKTNIGQCLQCVVSTSQLFSVPRNSSACSKPSTLTVTHHSTLGPTDNRSNTSSIPGSTISTDNQASNSSTDKETFINNQTSIPPTGNIESLVIIISCFGVTTIFFIALIIFMKYKRKENIDRDSDENLNNRLRKDENTELENIEPTSKQLMSHTAFTESDSQKSLTRKTILLVYAEDHICHLEVIKTFVVFLNLHCQCNVIFAPLHISGIMADKLGWINSVLDEADFTVIVNSVRAYSQYRSWKLNSCEKLNERGSPLADLFLSILDQIYQRQRKGVANIIMSQFSYGKKLQKLVSINYDKDFTLMNDLEDFLCHIHSLNKTNIRMTDVDLAFVDDYTQLREGKLLQCAIQKATTFENDNPNWFRMECYDSGLYPESLLEVERTAIKEHSQNHEKRQTGNFESVKDALQKKSSICLHDCHPDFLYVDENDRYLDLHESHRETFPDIFHPPSIISDRDTLTSDFLSQQMELFNYRNTVVTCNNMQPQHYVDCLNCGTYMQFVTIVDDEECISLGGKSV